MLLGKVKCAVKKSEIIIIIIIIIIIMRIINFVLRG